MSTPHGPTEDLISCLTLSMPHSTERASHTRLAFQPTSSIPCAEQHFSSVESSARIVSSRHARLDVVLKMFGEYVGRITNNGQ